MKKAESVVEYIYQHSLSDPDKLAVVGTDASCTYGQLWRLVTGVSGIMKERGVHVGDRVMLEAGNTVEYLACSYGVHLAGGVAVPVEPGAPTDRVRDIAAEIAPVLTVTGKELFRGLDSDFDTLLGSDFSDYEFPKPGMLQEILYTTGTTGKSKGVMITHGAQVFMCLARDAVVQMSENTVWLVPTPMNHAAGIRKSHMTMVRGSTIVLLDGFMNLKKLFGTISERKVTAVFLPPAAVHILLQFAAKKLAELDGKLDFLYAGSAAFPASEKQRLNELLPHVKKFDPYGSSEAGTTCMIEYSSVDKGNGCVGKPLPGYDVFIVDEEYRPMEATRENPGIVAVRTPALTLGYWNAPELTADAIRDGVIYMTDMGYFDEEGYLYVVGRRDDVINIGGLKIAPSEVEDVALRYESISECVCIPYEDRMFGRCMKMLVVLNEGYSLDPEAINRYLENNLEAYKMPKFIEQIREIPKTYNGKIDRKKLTGR